MKFKCTLAPKPDTLKQWSLLFSTRLKREFSFSKYTFLELEISTDITKINVAIYCRINFLAQPYSGVGPKFTWSSFQQVAVMSCQPWPICVPQTSWPSHTTAVINPHSISSPWPCRTSVLSTKTTVVIWFYCVYIGNLSKWRPLMKYLQLWQLFADPCSICSTAHISTHMSFTTFTKMNKA